MAENKIIHQCSNCSKTYKSKKTLEKHQDNCKEKSEISNKKESETTETSENSGKTTENNYDVNMTFEENDKVEIEIKKKLIEDAEGGEEVLKGIVKPKISNSYQEEIDKLEKMVKMIQKFPVSSDPAKKDQTIAQLKNTINVLLIQSKNLIKEMQTMSRRNSYFKNNIILAAFILDKCRKDVPETEQEFQNMFD
jgi:hypothetical protein